MTWVPVKRRSSDPNKKIDPVVSLCHPIQQRQDRIARSIPNRVLLSIIRNSLQPGKSLQPRGIVNPGHFCYQNSVYQSLMHTPIFVRWIDTHTRVKDCEAKKDVKPPCVKCNLKQLTYQYWDAQVDSIFPISGHNVYLGNIRETAWTRFRETHLEDASEYYNWIIEQLDDENDKVWHDQLVALYGISYKEYYKCRVCGVERPGAPSPPEFSLEVAMDEIESVEEAVERYLGPEKLRVHCESRKCRKARDGTRHERYKQITAGPKVLRVTLKITEYSLKGLKISTAFEINEFLDLTEFQAVNKVPLRYRLASVISHRGKTLHAGHYIASVRSFYQSEHRFYHINDDFTSGLSQIEFSNNPQRPIHYTKGLGFNVYTLTYLRDEKPLRDIRKLLKNSAPGGLDLEIEPTRDVRRIQSL